ncbi:MAG: hypothetical protein JWN69_2584 [Alphaproteobacteria bacterium]|nr:hypothetical protein [Alphaproteobacteria bacterium]
MLNKAHLAGLLALIGAPAAAQAVVPRWNPKASENNQLIPAFNHGAVESVLNAIGARHQRSGSDPAKPMIVTILPSGQRAVIALSACNRIGTACKALSIQASWTEAAAVPPQRLSEAIGRFNQRYAFAKAFVTADGRPALQYYLTGDFGFLRGNLAVDLLVFADQAERFAREVLQPLGRK